jgi:hypothetical protein
LFPPLPPLPLDGPLLLLSPPEPDGAEPPVASPPWFDPPPPSPEPPVPPPCPPPPLPVADVQVPPWHAPSEQGVPSGFSGFEQMAEVGSHAPASWHSSSAVQTTGSAPPQTPPVHASVWVQPLPSSQAAPSGFAGLEQTPVALSHVPASWHESEGEHVTGIPAHAPESHASFCVQASLSSHPVPSAFAGFEHTPVAVSHTPGSWHWSGAGHTTGEPLVQLPAWHVSPWVQAFASSHAVPLGLFGFEHNPVAALHVP